MEFDKPSGPSWWQMAEVGGAILEAAQDLWDIGVDLWDRNFGDEEPKVIKTEPPINNQIKPTQDKIVVIMPPPTTITNIISNNVYNKTTNVNVNIDITLPQRILPDDITNTPTGGGGGSTNTQTTYTSEVKSSLMNHKFGCMLMKPFYESQIDWCEVQDYETFYEELKAEAEADYNDVIEEQNKEEPNPYLLSKVATGFISTSAMSDIKMLIGLKQFNAISKYYTERSYAVAELPVTGKFTNSEILTQQCITTNNELPTDLMYLSGFSDDCSVPLTFFSDIDGYKKDQLQVIFRSATERRRKRSITMPSVGDINSIDPTNVFTTLPFGGTLIEIWHDLSNVQGHIQPVQKCKFYSGYNTKDEVEEFVYGVYAEWLSALCQDVEIKAYQIIIQDETKEEKYHKGDYAPYRAVYMGWDKDKVRWCNKKAWYLTPKKP